MGSRVWLLVGTLVLLQVTAVGQASAQVSSPKYAAAIAESRARILDTMEQLQVPGAQIAVIKDGELIWSEGFGLADVEQQVPVTPITRFRVASISKSMTSIALGLLIEQGKLDLDAEVQRYVPDFPRKPWPVTVRQVAGHIAGFRHYRGDEFESMTRYATVHAGLVMFENDSLLFEPGTKYSYSTYGWSLISAVVEGASGESFLPFMQRRVFGPMGMTHTGPDYPDSIVAWRAHAYTHRGPMAPAQNAPYVDNSYKWAGGGFLSTAEDLARFARNLLAGRVIKRETVELLWTSLTLNDGKPTGYGLGWGTTKDAKGRRRINHTGGAMGGTSHIVIYPEENLILALTVNDDVTFIGLLPRIGERFLQ